MNLRSPSLLVNTFHIFSVSSVVAILGLFASAPAADYTWGGGDLNWTDTSVSAWNGGPPTSGDTATIPSGRVEVSAGITGNAAINIGAGGQLWLTLNGLTVSNPITLNGITSGGALVSGDGPAGNLRTQSGQVTLAATSNIATWWNDKTFEISGKITGPGGLILDRATSLSHGDPAGGRFIISGSSNDFSGSTTVNGRAAGDLYGFPAQSQLFLGASNALPAATALTLNTADLFLNGFSQTLSAINGSGAHHIRNGSTAPGSLILNMADSHAFAGILGGAGSNDNSFSLTKLGTGTLTLSGANTFLGNTTVQQGGLTIASGGSLRFLPTTAGQCNAVSGSTNSSLSFLGTVVLDLSAATTADGNFWNLFHLSSFSGPAPILNPTAVTSSLGAFGEISPGTWELAIGGAKWTFSENNGSLTYANTVTGYESGLTFRLYDIQEPMDQLYPLVPGQTPNVDQKRSTIDWSTSTDFAGYSAQFLVECFASLNVPTAGSYEFRLISDDGSELWIGETLVIDHDGEHAATPMDGSITLSAGLHPLKLRFFQSGGGFSLKLEWRPPGTPAYVTVPASAFLTPAGVTRVVAPGKKQIITPGDNSRPGNGQPLVAVHPSWRVTTVHPASFNPKVGAMAVHPTDGRLFITTFDPNQGGFYNPGSLLGGDGKVWALTNTQGEDPEAVTVTEVAAGLFEPLGMKFINGELYVTQRTTLTRLRDTNSDGYFETKDDISGGWISDNYHHFHFGLIERDGFAYSTLSTAIHLDFPGLSGPNPPNRGTLLRTNLATGEVTFLAGGLRTPNGIGFGPQGEIFQTDNQGSWMPASRLNHLQPGKFYGHYNTTAGGGSPSLFADQAPSPPAVWFPHNEIANSPSQPLSIPDGPFAGDLLVGDITLGGINRVSLEKIGGVWQGCIYRFTQGLEGGVNRLAWGPNGTLYVGCIGGGGNWAWNETTTGLQRLTPKSGNPVTFEVAKVTATATGFEIAYTLPIPETTLENPANFTVRQWSYQPTADYGGPKIGEEALTVSSATASADRTRVTLVIPGLEKGHVVYLKSNPVSDSGSLIHSSEVWYTLNEIPGTPYNLQLSSSIVPENKPSGTPVGTLSASHDISGDALTFSLPAGVAQNALFSINGGVLTTASPFDYERRSSYQVRVRVTSPAGLFSEETFHIAVSDVTPESAPRRILLTNSVLPPDHPAGALVGRLVIDDADLGDLPSIPFQPGASGAVVEESFAYPAASSLSGQAGGSGFSGAWQGGNANVLSGSLSYTDSAGLTLDSSGNHGRADPGSRSHRLLAGARGADGTTTYTSFIADPSNNVHFWGVEFWNGGSDQATRVLQLGNEDGFGVRVRNVNNKFFTTSDSASHFFVIKIQHLAGHDQVSVWIDPPLSSEPPTPDLSFTPAETGGSLAFDRIGFSDYVETSMPAIDELRIGNTWNSVTPHPVDFPHFALVAGEGDANNSFFTIDGNRLTAASVLPAGLHRLRVRATDSNGLARSQPLLVWVGAGHLDSNADGTDDATASRLGFDPLGPIHPGAYFGSSGTSPIFGPGSSPRDFLLTSATLPGNLYWIETSPNLSQWTLEKQSLAAPMSFLESWNEWPLTRPAATPRHFWRIGGGWPAAHGIDPLANGLAGLSFSGGSAGWTYDATTGILRHDTAAPSDWLHFPGEYGDFLLSLDYRLSENGNSGVFVRSATTGYPWVTGSEIQLTHESRLPIHSTGSLYDRIPAEPAAAATHSVWHRLEVLMIGGRIRVKVDGVTTVDQADVRLSHPGFPWSDRGVIGLQNSHGAGIGRTEFRRIKIIDLAP
jgi:autotransporter-associated beta strand protein